MNKIIVPEVPRRSPCRPASPTKKPKAKKPKAKKPKAKKPKAKKPKAKKPKAKKPKAKKPKAKKPKAKKPKAKKPKAKKPKPIPALGARGKETHGAVHPPGPGPGALPLALIFQSHYRFETVLDLGCGVGHLFPVLGKRAKKIIGMDMIPEEQLIHRPPPSVEFEYRRCDVDWSERLHGEFDAIIACNIIEHVADTERFLRWFFSAIPEDGAWCLIFPLPKDELGDGHVHVFNHGLMLYNIVRIGIDCHKVEMYSKGYACAIMGKKRTFKVPKLANGTGDIAKLSSRFPFPAKHRCDAFDVPGLVVLRPDRVQIIRWCVTKYYGFGEED